MTHDLDDHKIVKCSCGTMISQCRCIQIPKPVQIVQDGCPRCAMARYQADQIKAITDSQ